MLQCGVFVAVDDFVLNTVCFGDPAGPVFLAHGGWVGNWELWQEPFQLLQHVWRCVGYDHRGAGVTTARPAQITPQALVDDVFRVMDAFGVDTCVLAGESLGAVTCMAAVLQEPARFTGLVLVDGASSGGTTAPHPMIEGIRADYPATVRWFTDACVPEPDSEHLRRWGRQCLLRTEPELAARMFECFDEEPMLPAAESIAVPTLILHGEQDRIIPPAVGAELAARIPAAELVLLAGAGHVPTLSRPRQVVAAITDWAGRHGLDG